MVARKDIEWIGGSKEVLAGFPKDVRAKFAADLTLVRDGKAPVAYKQLPSVGRGVAELKSSYDKNTYRVLYVVRKRDKVYVLHAFMKKDQKISKKEMQIIKQRLKEI